MPFIGRRSLASRQAERTTHRGPTVYIATFSMGALRQPSHLIQPGLHRAAHGEGSDAGAASPETATIGGWFGSSLDLLRGLDVRDLGPAERLEEWEGALAAA
jgi:hypothetical protein